MLFFFGQGGLTAREMTRNRLYLNQAAIKGDIAILVCGSNDLDTIEASRIGGRGVAERIIDNWSYLERKGVVTFVLGIGERYKTRSQTQQQFHRLSSNTNRLLKNRLPEGRLINFSVRSESEYFDGVHLEDRGYCKLLEQIDRRIGEMLSRQ